MTIIRDGLDDETEAFTERLQKASRGTGSSINSEDRGQKLTLAGEIVPKILEDQHSKRFTQYRMLLINV